MRFPPFRRQKEGELICIPLEPVVQIGFGVYFLARVGAPLTPEEAQPLAEAWLEGRAEDPLRGVIREYLRSGYLKVHVGERKFLPPPPREMLRHAGAGELEERRFGEATHLAVLSVPDALLPPRAGFWAALAAARALAENTEGVILDAAIPRLLPVASHTESVPPDGRIRIVDHIIIGHSVDRRGLAWITTKGMEKFGLPDLEIRDAPPNVAAWLGRVMNGMACALAVALLERNQESRQPAKELRIGPEVRLGLGEIAEASDPWKTDDEELPEGARGWTTIRLEYQRPQRGLSAFVRLVPPRAFTGDQSVWLLSALSDLFGSEDPLRQVQTGSEQMEIAHRRALAELPDVRRRFQAGLRPGAVLYVKHGFPARDGGREFMWVVVNRWSGDRIVGQLANDPSVRMDLRAGQQIELTEEDVFDWLLTLPDGSQEGGYTSAVVEREGRPWQ